MSGIKKITDEVKAAVAKSTEPMKNLTAQAKSMASQSASSVSQMKAQMKSYSNSIQETTKQQEYLKSQLAELKDMLSKADMGFEVGDTMKIEADIEKLENRLRKLQKQGKNTGTEISSGFDKIKVKVKAAGGHIASLGSKLKNVLSSNKNLGKSFSSTFNNGINSIKKFALGLLSIRTAFSMVSKAMQSYLSYDTQLSDSIQNCWNVLGSLLAPILEYVVGLFSKAVSYINAFVQALTGINLVARANSKAINNQTKAIGNQTKATKKLSEAQSSLDELHTVNIDNGDNNGSGSGLGDFKPITVEEVDLSKLQPLFNLIEELKKLLATLFDPIKQAWENKGKTFIDSIKNAFEGIKNLGVAVFSSIFEVWTNGTGQKYVENQLQIFTNLFNIVGALSQAFANAWKNAGNGTAIIQAIAETFIAIQDVVNRISNSLLNWVMSDNFQSTLNVVFKILADLFRYIKEISSWMATMYETYIASVVDKILNGISKIILVIGAVWDFLQPLIESAINIMGKTLEPSISNISNAIGGIVNMLTGVLDFLMGIFTGNWDNAINGLKEIVVGFTSVVHSLFSSIFDPLINGAKTAWEIIKSVFSTVAIFFGNIFSVAWNKVKDIFSVGGKIFSGIKEGIEETFKNIVNKIISGINKIMAVPFNKINSMLNKIRSIEFLSISPFKSLWKENPLSVPNIPSLASGGVLDKETIVRVAEYSNAKSNPEIVSPRDMMKETMKEALEESSMNNQSQKMEVEITGETRIDGDDIVVVYDKAKNNKGYDGGKNPSFAY